MNVETKLAVLAAAIALVAVLACAAFEAHRWIEERRAREEERRFRAWWRKELHPDE